ncbi:YezD family protein [Bacillus sp. REN16]|uniref:YezD family protein n=1 Tax=Bacillus sp. REN16 TaxID=2887296 RepID=UPI001E35B801|nr:YezD family protein [Bacillus sp. REN16]MCC3357869.1 YezD family protein [Bacillus sp. REN16]
MAALDEAKVKHILSTLENLEFGSIVITVHNGEITQIDATEKRRFTLQKSTSNQPTHKYTK